MLALPGFASASVERANRRGLLGDIVFDAALDALKERGDVQEIVRRGEADFVGEFAEVGGQSEDGFTGEGREHEHPGGGEIHRGVEKDAVGLVGCFRELAHELVGPYQDPKPYPMEQALGITPQGRKRGSRAGERGPGEPAILVHAADEVGDAGEFQLGADPGQERHVDWGSVEIAGEVEQMRFEQLEAGMREPRVYTPRDTPVIDRIIEQIDSDRMLLFASDYPHWQFEGDAVLPGGLSPALLRRIRVDNPLDTYPRLKETVQ